MTKFIQTPFLICNPIEIKKLQVLGRAGLDDDLLTADVEEEYDALNDETFNQAANGM